MPSLTASFVDVLDQSVNFTHLCARHYVVNVLVPALAKLAAQLVADLLIAAGLVGEPLRVGSVYFFVHMLTPSTSLILKHVVGSASGAHGATTGKAARAAARAAVCAALHCEAVQRGLFALARGNIHADPRSTARRPTRADSRRQRHDGAPVSPRGYAFPSWPALTIGTWDRHPPIQHTWGHLQPAGSSGIRC